MELFYFIAVPGNVLAGVVWGEDLIVAFNIMSINPCLTVKSVSYRFTGSIDLHHLFFFVMCYTVQI